MHAYSGSRDRVTDSECGKVSDGCDNFTSLAEAQLRVEVRHRRDGAASEGRGAAQRWRPKRWDCSAVVGVGDGSRMRRKRRSVWSRRVQRSAHGRRNVVLRVAAGNGAVSCRAGRVASVPQSGGESERRGAGPQWAQQRVGDVSSCMRQSIRSRRGCRAWGGVPGTRAAAVVEVLGGVMRPPISDRLGAVSVSRKSCEAGHHSNLSRVLRSYGPKSRDNNN